MFALPGILLFQLGRIRCIKLNAEAQHWIDEWEAHLAIHRLLQIQPVFGVGGNLLVFQAEVVGLK